MAIVGFLLYDGVVDGVDLQKISLVISRKIGKSIEVVGMDKVGSGYHSDGFKLTTKGGHNFFLKQIKSNNLGFEIPERRLSSLLISNNMCHRSQVKPQSIGVILENQDEFEIIPEINEKTVIYNVQEFQSDGVSYWSLLQDRKYKLKVDEDDLVELKKINDYINKIHKIKHPYKDIGLLKSVYNDGLRSILINPELTVTLLQDFTDSHQILPTKEHGNYVGLMLNLIYKWKDRYDRLVALHGDFWGTNLFFKKNGSIWVIDYSRIPWGDRGIDIACWLSQYLWFYHETKNPYFKELGEFFLDIYVEKSGDKEIRQAVSLMLGLMGVIYISPRFYPDLNIEAGKRFFDNILEILKSNQFVWTS